ncbi:MULTISPECIES: pyridoxamine 5'-phosphate oxidase family protein [Bacillaceae]|uniref:Pyridoxamine 5'-phosphate oxidase N-terminal domain-containing protein n=1 Tax=Gottfriedia luciferensis TaxID=178774 RepID=A0ABX2ZKY6_9BACI|nr:MULTISPECIES: pyridoxamine 5'-phosphate oxidase family protein [Bacillaceae]ODG90067.1 hypothetical protein BED47_14490 [Gottfriedia luciferensis]SFD10747.1 General stress protein 26 [Bacillus sp. UNCCL81]
MIQQNIMKVLKAKQLGLFTTIREDFPHSCYMVFFFKGLTPYIATNKNSQKVEDIKKNPNVHILLGHDGDRLDDNFVEMFARAEVIENAGPEEKVWTEELSRWLEGPEDPNYVLIQMTPVKIGYVEKAGTEPTFIKL